MHLDRLVSILGLQLQIRTDSCVSEVLKAQKDLVDLLQHISDANALNAKGSRQPKPVWMVPMIRNPDFVGREKVLQQLENKLRGPSSEYQRIAVLYGLGGIG